MILAKYQDIVLEHYDMNDTYVVRGTFGNKMYAKNLSLESMIKAFENVVAELYNVDISVKKEVMKHEN